VFLWLTNLMVTRSTALVVERLRRDVNQLIAKSAIRYETLLNLYKGGARFKPGEAARFLDKLVLISGRVIAKALTKGAQSVAFVPIMIRLSLHSVMVIRARVRYSASRRRFAE
jgi:hypothetical protein